MSEEQEAFELVAQTTMTPREARFFLWILADWQRNHGLSNEEAVQIKEVAIEAAAVQGISPVETLRAIYVTLKAYGDKRTQESFAKAMQFRAGMKQIEASAGRASIELSEIQRGILVNLASKE